MEVLIFLVAIKGCLNKHLFMFIKTESDGLELTALNVQKTF
jgi:hypothetical protein